MIGHAAAKEDALSSAPHASLSTRFVARLTQVGEDLLEALDEEHENLLRIGDTAVRAHRISRIRNGGLQQLRLHPHDPEQHSCRFGEAGIATPGCPAAASA